MALRRIVGFVLCVSVMSVTPGVSADRVSLDGKEVSGAPGGVAAGGVESADAEPRISGALPRRTDGVLRQAFPVAQQRVRDLPECQGLFAALGADALEKLTSSIYYPTTAQMESRVCQRGVSAFTYVGSPQTRLCRRFAALGTDKAAVALIHEALHGAGLSEKPLDKDGLEPSDIDRMVRKACNL